MATPAPRGDWSRTFEGRSAPYVPRAKTIPFFLSNGGQIYSDKIARFIVECDEKTAGGVIARLEDRFHTIFIDEIQDMAGYDLDLLELILRSKIDLVMVGDHRQATYSTNNAAKNRAYAGTKIIAKFRGGGLVTLVYARETHRFLGGPHPSAFIICSDFCCDSGLSRSIIPILNGFLTFERDLHFAG